MISLVIKVRIKPEQRRTFLEAIEGVDLDEPGCLRFEVLQAEDDENAYYFFEIYKDKAPLDAHRAAPHYAVWRAAAAVALDGPPEVLRVVPIFPADSVYWRDV